MATVMGCATHVGPATVHPDGTMECQGVTLAIGEACSCGTCGGTLSGEFVALIQSIAQLARSVLPGGPAVTDQ